MPDHRAEKLKANFLVINKPKKILIVTGDYPPAIGGMAAYAGELKDELPETSKDKIRAIILNAREAGRYPAFLRPLVIFLKALYRGRFCDLIYALEAESGGPARRAARILKKPFWLRANADDLWGKTEKRQKRFLALAKLADRVIVPNNAASEYLALTSGLPREQILSLPMAVALPEGLPTREALRAKWKVEGKIALASGRLIARKNFGLLCELWPAVLERYPEAKLLIAGSGPDEEKLNRLIKERGIEDSVMLAGLLPREMLFTYLRLADLFLIPSLFECGSHSRLEATAAGTPIVAFASLDTDEDKTAVTAGDKEAFLGAVTHGFSQVPRAGSSSRGRDDVEIATSQFIRAILSATSRQT